MNKDQTSAQLGASKNELKFQSIRINYGNFLWLHLVMGGTSCQHMLQFMN